MTILRVPSPAKLNLFLHIVGRRDNGYHELQSIFQLIDLYDWISFEAIEENQIQIEGVAEVKLEQNLIYRAAQYLRLKDLSGKKYPDGGGSGWWLIQCRNHIDCTEPIMAVWVK